MLRSSDRGQTEPLVALVAVLAMTLGLGMYAGVLDSTIPGQRESTVASTALAAVEDRIAPAGVVDLDRLGGIAAAGPSGYETNATVTVGHRRWTAGPDAPSNADRANLRVAVRVAPAQVRPGRLTVVVW